MAGRPPPGQDEPKPLGDVGIVIEAEDRVRLGQRLGQLGSVALSQTADRNHRLLGPTEVGGVQDGVDRILLRRLDEATGVDHDGRSLLRIVDDLEAVGR